LLVSGLGSLSPAPSEIYSREKEIQDQQQFSLTLLSFFLHLPVQQKLHMIFSLANLQTTFLTAKTKAIYVVSFLTPAYGDFLSWRISPRKM